MVDTKDMSTRLGLFYAWRESPSSNIQIYILFLVWFGFVPVFNGISTIVD